MKNEGTRRRTGRTRPGNSRRVGPESVFDEFDLGDPPPELLLDIGILEQRLAGQSGREVPFPAADDERRIRKSLDAPCMIPVEVRENDVLFTSTV